LNSPPESGGADPQSHRQWLGLGLLLALASAVYLPGLSGGFLFDDFVNLDALGRYGRVDTWPVFWRYITSGTADPVGRPLALLTFLLDARDWPADPRPFLRTNLLIHLLNGALLFLLLRHLQRVLRASEREQWTVALFATALWLLHPLFVSTTLYAVQRQAMLPATISLLGLLAYGSGRVRFSERGDPRSQWLMAGGLVLGTVFATLCKANGVLLPLLAAVLEWTVYSRLTGSGGAAERRLGQIRLLLLVLPSLVVLAYLATFVPHLGDWSAARGFSPAQRLLSQPRVLLDYLQLLAIPRAMSTGLFNDDYVVSTGMLHPWTTLPALVAIGVMVGGAAMLRHRSPALSAALLFFFAGQLLESSLINLELFFEHRNYLPALLLGWPVARSLHAWAGARTGVRIFVAAALVMLLSLTTLNRASLWGKPDQLAGLWALSNPDSPRAQSVAAIADTASGRPELALARLGPRWTQHPYDLGIAFNYIDARCQAGGIDEADKERLMQALAKTPRSELMTHQWLEGAISTADEGSCAGLDLADVDEWIRVALGNPVIANPHVRDQDIEPLLARLALTRKQPEEALRHFDRALLATPSPDVAARQASQLASAGYYEQAIAHLDTYERTKARIPMPRAGMAWLHAQVFEWQHYWPHEMALLRKHLAEAIRERGQSQ
jgi:tetratricopeptide (TPR) repeat protein